MRHRVELTARAKADAAEAYAWIRERSPTSAVRWFNGLHTAFAALATHPARCPCAPEAELIRREVRQLLYGRRRNVYRILFEIRGDTVYVLHIRHSARRPLQAHELGEEEDPGQ